MSECLFCKLVKGDLPCTKVFENEKVLAFLDIGPVNIGHTLVIPKEHHKTILEIPDDTLKELSLVLKHLSGAVKEGVDADGINIGMNNFEAAGQVVPHAHFHIMPRFKDDGLKLWPQVSYEDGQIKKIADKIVSFL
jgi:histidine triad (HIT) family protein